MAAIKVSASQMYSITEKPMILMVLSFLYLRRASSSPAFILVSAFARRAEQEVRRDLARRAPSSYNECDRAAGQGRTARAAGAPAGAEGESMIEIALLATTVVSRFLVPLFKKGKEGFSRDLAETEGRAAAEGLIKTAEAIWHKITGRFSRDNEKSAVSLFTEDPENMQNVMINFLQKRLEEDADFRKQIEQLVDTPVSGTGQTSWQLMGEYVGAVDARGAQIGGNASVAGVMVNPARPSAPQKTTDPGEPQNKA